VSDDLLKRAITPLSIRSPPGGIKKDFGSSAITGGPLPSCRYGFPPEAIFKVQEAKRIENSETKVLDAMKTLNDPSGGFSRPEKVFEL
jgi:hypothetical protein